MLYMSLRDIMLFFSCAPLHQGHYGKSESCPLLLVKLTVHSRPKQLRNVLVQPMGCLCVFTVAQAETHGT